MPGQKKVKKVKSKLRPIQRPVFSETGVLDTEDAFFHLLCACLTLDILSDPHVGNKSDQRSTSQLSFDSVLELNQCILDCMEHWLNALIKKSSLDVSLPICIYSLLQPLLHPSVKTFYGVHKIAVELGKEAGPPTKEVIRLGNELFGADGYFPRKYGWGCYVGLNFLTQNSIQGEYRDITYTTQKNSNTAMKPGADNNKGITYMHRRANPRAAGMLKIGGNQVVGQTRSNLSLTEEWCLQLHTLILPQLKLTSKGVNVGALDSKVVPRIKKLDTLQRARVAYYMLAQGTANSLMGVTGVVLQTSGPSITDTAVLTCCNALSMLPSGSVPGDLMLPPDRTAFQMLQLAHAMVRDPSCCLTEDLSDLEYVLQAVYSVCKAQLGTTQVPQVMSEALVHSRTVLMPLIETASTETGYTLGLFCLDHNTGINGPFELWKETLAKDDQAELALLVQDLFSTASYLNRFCSTLSANLSSAPLKSTDASSGYLSIRTCAYMMDPLVDQKSQPIYLVPKKKEKHEQLSTNISPDAYANLVKSFLVLKPTYPHVLKLALKIDGTQLDEDEPADVALMAFVDETGKPLLHRIDKPELTRGMMSHIQGFSVGGAKLLGQTYNLPFLVNEDTSSDEPLTEEDKCLLTANGFYYLSDGGLPECDTAPRSSINNPNGANRNAIMRTAENIQTFGGLGGLGDIFKFLGGTLASAIPVVGPAVSSIINSL